MLWRTTQACHICESVSGQGWTSDLYSVLRFIHVHFWWNNCYISWSVHPFQTSMNCFTLTNVISECCSENSMKYSCNINSVLCTAYTVSSLVKFLSDYNLCPMLCHLFYVLDSGSLFLLVFFWYPVHQATALGTSILLGRFCWFLSWYSSAETYRRCYTSIRMSLMHYVQYFNNS